MRSNLAVLLLLATSGCGLLGSVDRSPEPIIYSAHGQGCLNGLRDKLTRYFKGEITDGEWSQAWDCTQNSLQTLDELIAGKGGIDVEDAHTLFSKVLLTERPFPRRLTEALLSLKAAILGGTASEVSRAELTRVRNLLRVFQQETTGLLPALRGKIAPREGMELALRAHAAFSAVIAAFPSETRLPISRATLEVLVIEGQRVLDWETSVDLAELAIAGKLVIAGGGDAGIEARAWGDVLEIASKLAAAFIAYRKADPSQAQMPNEAWELNYSLARMATEALKTSVALHGGAIPIDRFDRLIDAMPEGLTTFRNSTLKKVIDSATRRLFPSARPRTFDAHFLNQAIETFNHWTRRQTALETIFARMGLDPNGVTPEEFEAAAGTFASSNEARELTRITKTIRPMFAVHENEIVIQGLRPNRHTLRGLGITQTIDLAAQLVIDRYSTLPAKEGLTLAGAEALVEDFIQLSYDRGTADPTVPHYARRRFREASSYGPVSDGDATVTLVELTYYAKYVYSIEALAIRLRALVEEKCKVDDTLDSMKWKRMNAQCFRETYFGNVASLWKYFPRLQAHYRALDAEGRARLEDMVEHAARHKGRNDEPVGGYEAQSFSAVVHFEESYFERFDVNRNDLIEKDEALLAARNHRRNISEAGGIDPNDHTVLDAIYVFGVKHGRRPRREGAGLAEFLAWVAIRPFWKINATSAEVFRAAPLANVLPTQAQDESEAE